MGGKLVHLDSTTCFPKIEESQPTAKKRHRVAILQFSTFSITQLIFPDFLKISRFPSHSSYFRISSTMPIFPDFHNSDHTSMFPYFPNTAHVFRVPQDSPFFHTLIKNEKNASGTASAEGIKCVIQALNICCLFLSTKCMQLTISITKRTWLKFQIKSQK